MVLQCSFLKSFYFLDVKSLNSEQFYYSLQIYQFQKIHKPSIPLKYFLFFRPGELVLLERLQPEEVEVYVHPLEIAFRQAW